MDHNDYMLTYLTAPLNCGTDAFFEVENAGLKVAMCMALGEIGKSTSLPLPAGGEGDAEGEITKLSILNKLIGLIKTVKEINKVGVCVCVCARICVLICSWKLKIGTAVEKCLSKYMKGLFFSECM